MTDANPVTLIVGAGDYIGAAIARRFAAGGHQQSRDAWTLELDARPFGESW